MNKPASELTVLADLRSANKVRQAEWDPNNQLTLAFRGNELAGEVGEACNVIKKLEREQMGIPGSRDTIAHLAEELADVVICADLTASSVDVDLDQAVRDKFNATSEKYGFKTRLAANQSGSERAGVDAVRLALETARQAIEYSIDMGGTDPGGVLLQALNKADAALATPPAQPAPARAEAALHSPKIAAADDDTETCIACNIAFVEGDLIYPGQSGGCIHVSCCGPEMKNYVNADGEPLKDGDPLPTPQRWTSVAAETSPCDAYRDVIDEALVVRHLGVAKGDARAELNQILDWDVAAALDPAVSGRKA